MSGRINNPGELVRLSSEVEHMKAALVEEEDAELLLLEEQERLDKETGRARAELDGARARGEAAAPGLRPLVHGRRPVGLPLAVRRESSRVADLE